MRNPFKRHPPFCPFYTYPANGGTDAGTAMLRMLANTLMVQRHGVDIANTTNTGLITVTGKPKNVAAFRAEKERNLAREQFVEALMRLNGDA